MTVTDAAIDIEYKQTITNRRVLLLTAIISIPKYHNTVHQSPAPFILLFAQVNLYSNYVHYDLLDPLITKQVSGVLSHKGEVVPLSYIFGRRIYNFIAVVHLKALNI